MIALVQDLGPGMAHAKGAAATFQGRGGPVTGSVDRSRANALAEDDWPARSKMGVSD